MLGVTSLIVVLFDDLFCKILTEKKVNSLGKANTGVHCSRGVKRCKKRKAWYFSPWLVLILLICKMSTCTACATAIFWAVHLQSLSRQHSLLHVQLTQFWGKHKKIWGKHQTQEVFLRVLNTKLRYFVICALFMQICYG